jgi:flagellar assembly protein FliH
MGQEFSFETLEAPVPRTQEVAADALARAAADVAAERAAAREEGLRAGREEALAALTPAAAALEQASADVLAAQVAAADRLEAHAVDLALFLAEKVVGGALAVQPERVVEAVRGALRGILERERVTVLVHPDDLELVRESMDEVQSSLGGISHCVVEAERRVARGGAVVRTPDGDVDARIETKLVRAREVIEAALEGP